MQNCNTVDNNGCRLVHRKHLAPLLSTSPNHRTSSHSGRPTTTIYTTLPSVEITDSTNQPPLWPANRHRHRVCDNTTTYGRQRRRRRWLRWPVSCDGSDLHHHHHHHPATTSTLFLSSTATIVFISILASMALVPTSTISTSDFTTISQHNKNSGHFFISQLCAGRSQFPVLKQVEGAVLSSAADTDVNCTMTFRTKSAQQHFVIRFEELKLDCNDHLKMFDGDLDYGQPSIKDFSCRDSLASVPVIKTTGTFLTMHFSSNSKSKLGDGFRLVLTAVFDVGGPNHIWDCPPDYTLCQNKRLCISRSLFCDDVNHCLDNSDEENCSRSGIGGTSSGSIFAGELTLSNALGLLIVLVLIIFTCVMIFISAVYCRRESHYAQHQHHLQRAIGVPLQTSSSLMFTNPNIQQPQPQYHYPQYPNQPANLSPYILVRSSYFSPQAHNCSISNC